MTFERRHPLAQPSHSSLHLYYGGNYRSVLTDSLTLLRQASSHLAADERILVLNTLFAPDELDYAISKISERRAAKILTFSASGRALIQKLFMLTCLIVAKKVKCIVLNSMDFAAETSRQRTALVHWLREMRDVMGCSVAVYVIREPVGEGALMQLLWVSDRCSEVGEWRESDARLLEEVTHFDDVVLNFVEELEREEPRDPSGATSEPFSVSEFLALEALKNIELEVYQGRGAITFDSLYQLAVDYGLTEVSDR